MTETKEKPKALKLTSTEIKATLIFSLNMHKQARESMDRIFDCRENKDGLVAVLREINEKDKDQSDMIQSMVESYLDYREQQKLKKLADKVIGLLKNELKGETDDT